jgi:hypothetical protein
MKTSTSSSVETGLTYSGKLMLRINQQGSSAKNSKT